MAHDLSPQTDLSEGEIPDNLSIESQLDLDDSRQKRRFRLFSFVIAWTVAVVFLLSVLCFSYRIVHDPSQYGLAAAAQYRASPKAETAPANHDQANATSPAANPMNQLLILLSLLSAVGTTLAVSVMRFSFAKECKAKDEEAPTPISPIASSLGEVLKATADLLKKDK